MDLLLTIFGALLGTLLGSLISRHLYEKGEKQTDIRHKEMKDLAVLTLRWQELKGCKIAFVRNESNDIIGLVHESDVVDEINISVKPISGELKTST